MENITNNKNVKNEDKYSQKQFYEIVHKKNTENKKQIKNKKPVGLCIFSLYNFKNHGYLD